MFSKQLLVFALAAVMAANLAHAIADSIPPRQSLQRRSIHLDRRDHYNVRRSPQPDTIPRFRLLRRTNLTLPNLHKDATREEKHAHDMMGVYKAAAERHPVGTKAHHEAEEKFHEHAENFHAAAMGRYQTRIQTERNGQKVGALVANRDRHSEAQLHHEDAKNEAEHNKNEAALRGH